jgi:tetratricopeptide (TPR) repeat protein
VLAVTDPAAAAEAARTAVGHLRRVGLRVHLAYAVTNLAEALVQLGDWDAAEAEFTRAVSSYGLADMEQLTCQLGWLTALRGDAETAETILAALTDMRASEDHQDRGAVSLADAFTASARGQREIALRLARDTLARADVIGISSESMRWAWPLAVRTAHELGDDVAVGELIALLDSHQPGHLAPMLRAERDLARARLGQGDFAAAVTGLRERSTPYHPSHGLLDHAECQGPQTPDAAALAIDEARTIGERLRCQPLLVRADAVERTQSRIRA